MNKKQPEFYIGKLIEFNSSGNIYLGVCVKDDQLYVVPIFFKKPLAATCNQIISEYDLKYKTTVIY